MDISHFVKWKITGKPMSVETPVTHVAIIIRFTFFSVTNTGYLMFKITVNSLSTVKHIMVKKYNTSMAPLIASPK